MRAEAVHRALDACYEAVSEPELWQPALHALAASLDSACAMFYPKDVGERATLVPSSIHYADLLEDYVAGGWYDNHYRAERGWPLLERDPTAVVIEHDLATDDERRRLAHYNDFYLKWGYPGFAAIGFRVEGRPWCLPLLRSASQGHFSREEAHLFARLGPDLRRMMHLSEQFAQARAETGIEALEHIGRAAMLLDWQGRAIEVNARAERLLATAADTIVLRDGRPRAAHAGSDRRLQALLDGAGADGHRHQRAVEALPVRIERPAGLPLIAELVSVRGLVAPVSKRAFAILLVTDPEERPRADTERLRHALGLTPGEALLAGAMAEGRSLESCADELEIAIGTARQRLKAVFAKTGTHRQGELVALLNRIMR